MPAPRRCGTGLLLVPVSDSSMKAGPGLEGSHPSASADLWPRRQCLAAPLLCACPSNYPDAHNLYLAEGVKKYLIAHGYQTPVVAVGKISTPQLAEEILQAGK